MESPLYSWLSGMDLGQMAATRSTVGSAIGKLLTERPQIRGFKGMDPIWSIGGLDCL
jgi:hypothetical protein